MNCTSHRTSAGRLRSVLGAAQCGAAILLLLWAAPDLPPPRTLNTLGDWLAVTPVDRVVTALAGLLGWLCLCWLTGGALLVALGRLPGAAGLLCAALSDRLTPVVLRRAFEGLLGTALASGSLAAALPAGTWTAAPDMPSAVTWAARVTAGSATAAPAATGTDQGSWPDLDRVTTVAQLPVTSGSEHGGPPLPTANSGRADVMVRRGDTLWAISRRVLGGSAKPAEVAAAWPRWYAANRQVIGTDPDVLHPGQILQPPH
jgi:resuscitation-promoting factor RpfA